MPRITRKIGTDTDAVRALRKRRYERDTDGLFWDAQEMADGPDRDAALAAWKAAKAAIRDALPYTQE